MKLVYDCLKGLIGIRGLCDSNTQYKEYINDIRGLGSQILAGLIDSDLPTVSELWDSVEREGIPAFYEAVISRMSDKISVRGMLSDIYTGSWSVPHAPLTIASVDTIYSGQEFDLRYSDNLSFYLSSVEVFVNNPPQFLKIKVVDLERGIEVGSFTSDEITSTGFVTVSIEQEYARRRLFIGYNAGEVQSIDASDMNFSYWRNLCERSCNNCGTFFYSKCNAIDTSIGLTASNLLGNQGGCGMIINGSVNCSLAKWVCANKGRMIQPLKYFMASELMLAITATSNINIASLVSKEDYGAIINEIRIKKSTAFKNLVKGAKIRDSVCIECEPELGTITRGYSLP